MINKLNEILKNDFNESPYKLEEFVFVESLVNIILSNKVKIKQVYYHSSMDLLASIAHSIEFIKSIDHRYSDMVREIIFSDSLNFITKHNDDKLSCVSLLNDKKIIDFYVRNTIEDSYTITHECFHFINLDLIHYSTNWSLITETISMTAEGLQKEYFKSRKFKDYRNNDINTFYAVKYKAVQLDFEIKLMKYYLKHKEVDDIFINSILDNNKFYMECIMDDINNVIISEQLQFYKHQGYIIGGLLSSLLVNKIINNPDDINMLIELNDNCNNCSFVDTLEYLGLKVIDKDNIILSDDSIKLLEKEYQKRLSKL